MTELYQLEKDVRDIRLAEQVIVGQSFQEKNSKINQLQEEVSWLRSQLRFKTAASPRLLEPFSMAHSQVRFPKP